MKLPDFIINNAKTLMFACILTFNRTKQFSCRSVFIANGLKEEPVTNLLRIKAIKYYADNHMFGEAKKEIAKFPSDKILSVPCYQDIAYVYCMAGDYDVAEYIFEKLLIISPNNEIALHNLSSIFLIKGEYDKSLKYAEVLIKNYPKNDKHEELYKQIKVKIEKSKVSG